MNTETETQAKPLEKAKPASHFKTVVVGQRFHKGATEAYERLTTGDELRLVPDPMNQYDANAIQVFTPEGQMLGFIPMDLSMLVMDLISRGLCSEEVEIVETKNIKKIIIWYTLDPSELGG